MYQIGRIMMGKYQFVNMYKKLFVFMMFFLVLGTHGIVRADYPNYLWGNKNFILCGAHMGYASYIDKTSLVVEEYNPPIYKLAIREIHVPEADRGNIEPSGSGTAHFMYNWESRRMYWWDFRDNEWRYIPPVGTMAETGHYFDGEMAFYLAYNMKFYGGQQWYSAREGRYMDPNFSDNIYTLIDGSR
ncbi:hypothetical protein HMPREF0908_0904 [Selenomonas flueggei ATCC 43531]|uniref:Uncharacterized protein n=2 Tax=Selenomonas TaxID=970 RepID=C4V2T4_9FIRM|nr:hypothetical protein HMPREF0908_0904 [Selenomonas flueggei ATCC 43531]